MCLTWPWKPPTGSRPRQHRRVRRQEHRTRLLRRGVEIMFEDKLACPSSLGIDNTCRGVSRRNGYPLDGFPANAPILLSLVCQSQGREYNHERLRQDTILGGVRSGPTAIARGMRIAPRTVDRTMRVAFEKHLKRAIEVLAEGFRNPSGPHARGIPRTWY